MFDQVAVEQLFLCRYFGFRARFSHGGDERSLNVNVDENAAKEPKAENEANAETLGQPGARSREESSHHRVNYFQKHMQANLSKLIIQLHRKD